MQRFSMLSDAGQNKGDGSGHSNNIQALAQLWQQVRALRGTPEPDAVHLASFVAGLNASEREKIESALAMAVRGREQPGDFSLISWAASCTRPALLAHLAGHGLEFTGSELFSCGLVLREQGWDIQARVAQLANNPADVATLRAMLPDAPETSAHQAAPSLELMLDQASPDDSLPDNAPPDEDTAPDGPQEPMDDMAVKGSSGHWENTGHWDTVDTVETMTTIAQPQALPASRGLSFESIKTFKGTVPVLPTRFERETTLFSSSPYSSSPASSRLYSALPSPRAEASATRQRGSNNNEVPQLKLRLFGKSAAHTLEITDHRRGGDFLGTHVVSIDSAAAYGTQSAQSTQITNGTYAWERKLVIQLTPEEMPAIVATLMGITPSARFGNHGADKSKFIEVRRQEGGLVIVTGDKAGSYSVPVPTRTAYYVLDLFCRAMAMNKDGPERGVSDVLALVRAVHGF